MALIGEMQYLTIGGNTYSLPSGAKTFIVTLTANVRGASDQYISDKSAEEIYDAYNDGRVVLLFADGSHTLLSSVYGEDNYYQANFYKSVASTGSFHEYQYIIVTDNGATSVDYTDYETPVNNATLTIQKNGSTVNSFTANASSNVTANITVPTKVSELTNDSGYITNAGVTGVKGNSESSYRTGQVNLTAANIGAAASSHAHGNITNDGDITATAPTIASGDQIVINDSSASKITNGPTFDGSTTTTALTPKGTWESFSKFSGSYNDLTNKPTIPTVPTATGNSETGISIANHSTTSIYGVSSSTTTASKVTLGTAFTIPNISVSTVAADDITSWSAGSGSFTSGAFSGGSGSFKASVTNNVLSFSHTHTAATHGADSHSHTAPSLSYTARSIGSASAGTAFTVPNVTESTNVTVPIKNSSSTAVVTGTSHTITDNGHTHTLG